MVSILSDMLSSLLYILFAIFFVPDIIYTPMPPPIKSASPEPLRTALLSGNANTSIKIAANPPKHAPHSSPFVMKRNHSVSLSENSTSSPSGPASCPCRDQC